MGSVMATIRLGRLSLPRLQIPASLAKRRRVYIMVPVSVSMSSWGNDMSVHMAAPNNVHHDSRRVQKGSGDELPCQATQVVIFGRRCSGKSGTLRPT